MFVSRYLAAVIFSSCLIIQLTWSCGSAVIKDKSISENSITHSFFVAGPDFTGILDEAGAVLWDAERPAARDGFVLADGHVLICWSDEVLEFDTDKKVVFRYALDTMVNKELGTVQRLDNGNTLVTELGSQPRLLEVKNDSSIAVEVPLQPETSNFHMQTRMARKLSNGNYLVPHLLAFTVKEYTPEGIILNNLRTDLAELGGREAENWPFTAIRLDNGHTLINLTHGNKVVELDTSGRIVWQISNDDFEGFPIDDACGGQRLPNGNTVIASYHAKEGVKLFEVTRDKKIVWTYTGPYRVHHFQILTTNGQSVPGPFLK